MMLGLQARIPPRRTVLLREPPAPHLLKAISASTAGMLPRCVSERTQPGRICQQARQQGHLLACAGPLQVLEARAGDLASGVPEFHVPYSARSCNLAFGNVGRLHGQPQQLRPSSQVRLARIQPGRVC